MKIHKNKNLHGLPSPTLSQKGERKKAAHISFSNMLSPLPLREREGQGVRALKGKKDDCQNNRLGFSIIELMTAMAIFAIMSLALYIVFDRANKVWEHGEIKTNHYSSSRTALEIMSREISSAIIAVGGPTSFTSSIYRPAYFLGTNGTTTISGNSFNRDTLVFCLSRSNAIYEVGYNITDNSTTGTAADDTLRRAYSSETSTDFDLSSITNYDMNLHIVDLNFTYYYENAGTYTSVNEWDSRMAYTSASTTAATVDDGHLPDFIEVTLQLVDSDIMTKYSGSPPTQERKTYKLMIPMNQRNFRND